MSKMRTYEYVWLEVISRNLLRSKIKATAEENVPDWSFDGSSTQQAGTGDSDCLLPVQRYESPLRLIISFSVKFIVLTTRFIPKCVLLLLKL